MGACIMLTAMAGLLSAIPEAQPGVWRVYIGTYTRAESEGIYLLTLDSKTGELTHQGLAAEVENPAFLALHPSKPLLYAVGEMDNLDGKSGGAVNAFALDSETGLLKLLNQRSAIGAGTCHVAVDRVGKNVAIANYGGGSVAILPIAEDGALLPASDFVQHAGSSVNPQRQERAHAHSVTFDPAGRFLFVGDLGMDQVVIYRYDSAQGRIAPNDPPFTTAAPGAGPRHFAFHPGGRFAYVINEMGSTITAFKYDVGAGSLEVIGNVTTLPADFTGESTTAEIRVHPSGRFVYGSNRGHDSIAAFAVDENTGMLHAIGHTPSGGKTPRNFNIDPTGNYLIAANQNSDNVVAFRINSATGALDPAGSEVMIAAPVCVIFAPGA